MKLMPCVCGKRATVMTGPMGSQVIVRECECEPWPVSVFQTKEAAAKDWNARERIEMNKVCERCGSREVDVDEFRCGSRIAKNGEIIDTDVCRRGQIRRLKEKNKGLEEEVERLEKAGQKLWLRAHAIYVEDTIDRHGDDATVFEIAPETVVLLDRDGDGITAGEMVDLWEALKEWKEAMQ